MSLLAMLGGRSVQVGRRRADRDVVDYGHGRNRADRVLSADAGCGGLRAQCCACARALGTAIAEGAQIVILPELAHCGYVFGSAQEARAAAQAADGELLAGWAQEAGRGDALVIGGFCELAPDGRVFNSSALVDGRRCAGRIRKLHLWNDESHWFAPGERPARWLRRATGGSVWAFATTSSSRADPRLGARRGGPDRTAHQLAAGFAAREEPILHSLALTTAYLSRVFVAVCDAAAVSAALTFKVEAWSPRRMGRCFRQLRPAAVSRRWWPTVSCARPVTSATVPK